MLVLLLLLASLPEECRTRVSFAVLAGEPLGTTDGCRVTAEVTAIHEDPLGKRSTRAWKEGAVEVWTKPLKDGSTAVGIFNRGELPRKLSIGWRDIGLNRAPMMILDVWRRTHPKPLPFGHPVDLPRHGVVLLRVR